MTMNHLSLQIKSFDDIEEEKGVFTAYANVKWLVDRVRDCTTDGAFNWNTKRHPKMLLNHDHKQVIGAWLEIEEDEIGLKVKGQLALGTQLGKETYELLKMGALDSLSIGYVVNKERYDQKMNVNFLEDITIHEISVVVFECNQGSLVESVKSDDLQLAYKNFEPTEPTEPVEPEVGVIEVIDQTNAETDVINTTDNKVSDDTLIENTELNITEETVPTVSDETLHKLNELVLAIKLADILK